MWHVTCDLPHALRLSTMLTKRRRDVTSTHVDQTYLRPSVSERILDHQTWTPAEWSISLQFPPCGAVEQVLKGFSIWQQHDKMHWNGCTDLFSAVVAQAWRICTNLVQTKAKYCQCYDLAAVGGLMQGLRHVFIIGWVRHVTVHVITSCTLEQHAKTIHKLLVQYLMNIS